ncbi:hypothetical protein Defa_05000 [Desulfovibrio sp. TH_2024_36128]|uniref:Uncharacterized protein n=1 Tax=Desulfovibrio falkowii TaxID=3136602 RepID=A0ABQ0E5L9_9BACT
MYRDGTPASLEAILPKTPAIDEWQCTTWGLFSEIIFFSDIRVNKICAGFADKFIFRGIKLT